MLPTLVTLVYELTSIQINPIFLSYTTNNLADTIGRDLHEHGAYNFQDTKVAKLNFNGRELGFYYCRVVPGTLDSLFIG